MGVKEMCEEVRERAESIYYATDSAKHRKASKEILDLIDKISEKTRNCEKTERGRMVNHPPPKGNGVSG